MKLLTKLDLLALVTLLAASLSMASLGALFMHNHDDQSQQQWLSLELNRLATHLTSWHATQPALVWDSAQHAAVRQLLQQQANADTQVFLLGIDANRQTSLLMQVGAAEAAVPALAVLKDLDRDIHKEFAYIFQQQAYRGLYAHLAGGDWALAVAQPVRGFSLAWAHYLGAVGLPSLGILSLWLLLMVHLNRRLARRIDATLVCVRAVTAGDLTAQITDPELPDEIGRLQQGINTMTTTLRLRDQQQTEAEQALQQENQHRLHIEQQLRQRLHELQKSRKDNQHSLNQLEYLANHDSLTGLYNRRLLQTELVNITAHSSYQTGQHALIFLDLDDFKYLNDRHGHHIGDQILIRCANELSHAVRTEEIFARIGGDEFAFLVLDTDPEAVAVLAERILHTLSHVPFQIEGKTLRLTASLGIALYPQHADDAESLLAHADAAMYQAKSAGKNTWRLYSVSQDSSAKMVENFSWSKRIEHAMENNLLKLFFQGIYRTADCSLAHLEVLIRMQDFSNPDMLMMPDRFIPLAEKTGLILDIDRFVISAAITLLARSERIPPLAVNVSGRSMEDPALPYFICRELESHGVDPKRLLIELTETSAVTDLHDAQNFIDVLVRNGCQLCLDDFGVGFSSFAYLKHLNVSVLKIDGLFIRNLAQDRDNQIFVKAIVDVARSMGKETIAEFVEDEITLNVLKTFGVDYVQGYYLHRPAAYHPAFQGVPVEGLKFPKPKP